MWVAHYAAAAVGHVAPVEHRPVGCNGAHANGPRSALLEVTIRHVFCSIPLASFHPP